MHGIIRFQAIAAVTTGEVNIGTPVVFPSDGPWFIHGVWCTVAYADATQSIPVCGNFIVDTVAGDIQPDPAPAQFPVLANPFGFNRNASYTLIETNIHSVAWAAPGKAQVQLKFDPDLTFPANFNLLAGILFGRTQPTPQPIVWSAGVVGQVASTAETIIGTVQLAESAERITGLFTSALQGDAYNAQQTTLIHIRLESDDKRLQPAQFPCMLQSIGGTATAAGGQTMPALNWIPLDIPVIGGTRITIYATDHTFTTNNPTIKAHIAYR